MASVLIFKVESMTGPVERDLKAGVIVQTLDVSWALGL